MTLPQFRGDPADALTAALVADATEGIDGVFVFDHLWAIGQPDRPAINCWPLLGALAATTEQLVLGTLVARVSLLPDAVLANNVQSLVRMVGADRFVAGLGAGDRLSEPENEAYGIPFLPLDERLGRLVDCVRRCRDAGATTWVGGLSPKVRQVAIDEHVPLNVWGVPAQRVADEHAAGVEEVTWGGVAVDQLGSLDTLLADLRRAGATWAVVAPAYIQGEPPDDAIARVAAAAVT